MRENLYVKIAYWYYVLGLTQDEIAKKLNLTRQKVNQIINSLFDMNIVSINIHGYERDHVELESKIEQHYGLNEVLVADDYDEPDTAIHKVANIAAQYLDKQIKNGDFIGVTWGKSLAETISQMKFSRKTACQVVQMIGAQNPERSGKKADEVSRGLAERLGCSAVLLYAPVVVEYPETREWLLKEKTIQSSFEEMKKCTLAVVGIGELNEQSTMFTSGYVTLDDLRILRSQGFVGDIAMNPIRSDGSYDHCPISDRLINASVDCLKKVPNVIAVVSGEGKVDATNAVLNSGCINTLIIDNTTAELLVARW